MNKDISTNHNKAFGEILSRIQVARKQAISQVNTALIDLYWFVGQTISERVRTEAWGKGVVKELAEYIAQNAP